MLVNENNAKVKYNSKVVGLYKAELDKREQADAALFPMGVVVDGATAPQSAPAEAGEDDFFDSWDKPPVNSSATAASAKQPVVGRATSSPAPRTVTSASLRAGSISTAASTKPARLGLGAARLNSSGSNPASGSVSAKKLGGLRASKSTAPIDFEKAQRDAEAEEQRIKQLGYDREREEKEAAAAALVAAEAKKAASTDLGGPAKSGLGANPSTSSTSGAVSSKLVGHQKGNSQDMSRLGMGMKRLALSNSNTSDSKPSSPSPSVSASAADSDDNGYARSKFANAKGISSDMYFGRGVHDPTRSAEDQARLQQFSGATSISSSAYFGRNEEDEMRAVGGSEGMLGDGSLEGLSVAARDALQRVMANPDVQNGVENLRAGAVKVR